MGELRYRSCGLAPWRPHETPGANGTLLSGQGVISNHWICRESGGSESIRHSGLDNTLPVIALWRASEGNMLCSRHSSDSHFKTSNSSNFSNLARTFVFPTLERPMFQLSLLCLVALLGLVVRTDFAATLKNSHFKPSNLFNFGQLSTTLVNFYRDVV